MKKSFPSSLEPEVSIIITSYNTEKLLEKCLVAIENDASLPATEIIVVDNASSDHTVEIVKKKFPGVKLIQNSQNKGLAAADNQGRKVAKGSYIVLLNTDAFVLPGTIKKLLGFLKVNHDVGAVAPRLLNADGSVQPSCFPDVNVKNTFLAYWLGRREKVEKYYPKSDRPTPVDIAVVSAIMIRKDLLDKIGGEDEKYFLYFQDFDLSKKIRNNGYKIVYLPDALVTHLHGGSGQSNRDFGYLKESLFYPFKKVFGLWSVTSSPAQIVQDSIRYFGWFRHLLITLIIKTARS